MPQMNAVEDTDGEVDRPARPAGKVPERFHDAEYQSADPAPTGEGSTSASSVTGAGEGAATSAGGGDGPRDEWGGLPVTGSGPVSRGPRRRVGRRDRLRCRAVEVARNGTGVNTAAMNPR